MAWILVLLISLTLSPASPCTSLTTLFGPQNFWYSPMFCLQLSVFSRGSHPSSSCCRLQNLSPFWNLNMRSYRKWFRPQGQFLVTCAGSASGETSHQVETQVPAVDLGQSCEQNQSQKPGGVSARIEDRTSLLHCKVPVCSFQCSLSVLYC